MQRWLGLASLLCVSLASPLAHAGLTLSTDHRPLFFGVMQLGEEKTLTDQGTYHNQITCTSTSSQAWHLKISLLHPLASGADTIPLDAFTWEVTYTSGTGTLTRLNERTPFRLTPDLVYMSNGSSEANGTAVTLQFRYALKIPEEQVSGTYATTIRFTLTELL